MFMNHKNLMVFIVASTMYGYTDIYLEISGRPYLIGTERLPEDFALALSHKIRVEELAHWDGRHALGCCPRNRINAARLRLCVAVLLGDIEDYLNCMMAR